MRNKLSKNWVCSSCNRRLPKGGGGEFGQVWRFRYEHYSEHEKDKANPRSGYYCDACTGAIEMGLDPE